MTEGQRDGERTLASAHVFDVYLELLQAGRLFDVAGRVVGDAVLTAHRVLVVAIAHDVAHAPEKETPHQYR